ncbi:MAG: translation initiation factor IF-2 [Bacteroidia bacterium]|nr:translation initiation factor IF-2 [Bacteroidia bacterium]
MSENKLHRLSKVAKDINQSLVKVAEFLNKNGFSVKADPNERISDQAYELLIKTFAKDKEIKEQLQEVRNTLLRQKKETLDLSELKTTRESNTIVFPEKPVIKTSLKEALGKEEIEKQKKNTPVYEEVKTEVPKVTGPKFTGEKIDLEKNKKAESAPKTESEPINPKTEIPEPDHIEAKVEKMEGPKVLGKIELKEQPEGQKLPTAKEFFEELREKQKQKKRKRIKKGQVSLEEIKKVGKEEEEKDRERKKLKYGDQDKKKGKGKGGIGKKEELSEEEIQQQIKETLARLTEKTGKSKSSKLRREKRELIRERLAEEEEKLQAEKQVLKVTEFLTANELATMMNVPVAKVISTCMALGLFVSINQRLDAETISIVAEEFGFKTKFVTVDEVEDDDEAEVESKPEDLVPRPPIITIMGHVDHGKTSLIDYIRKSNVVAGEAGGITQHIGSYNVQLENGRSITILDTPGHEAFTAMRARGAKITDIAIIVIAADDGVMPQTVEAINHAQAAGVPMIFAINKIDKPGANPNKIREELAKMNLLVEEWGGKYQSQEISAKMGTNVDLLLEKVLLEADIMDLKANPKIPAKGTVIEARLDKGKGHVADVIVQQGTLRVGDIILAGPYSGRVKAMLNERGQQIKEAGPSMPVQILGLDGSPAAGDEFKVMQDERKAREIANKRQQLLREQGMRTKKHITLDEIGRRLAVGDFKELNIIVKGDVDGSIEALSDALLKLSTEKIAVNIIHKSVGAISESDVMLASASNAIIVGFQVRPTPGARKLAETEQIDIRLYSIIYNAIEEIKAAMEGMLSPEYKEKVVCNVEVREVFKISKVGNVAGCYVLDGKITRNTKIRVIRDGIVVYEGNLGSLKRFKDDVKEVTAGFECGLNIENFNDIKVGDIIEGYELEEVKAKL